MPVRLDNFGINVELTSTDRVGFHKYTYDNPKERRVLLDLGHILQPNWGHKLVGNEYLFVNDSTVEGTVRTQDGHISILSLTGSHSRSRSKHYTVYRRKFTERFAVLASQHTRRSEIPLQICGEQQTTVCKSGDLILSIRTVQRETCWPNVPGWDSMLHGLNPHVSGTKL